MGSSPQSWQAIRSPHHSLHQLIAIGLHHHPLPKDLDQLPSRLLNYQPSPHQSLLAHPSLLLDSLCLLLGLKDDAPSNVLPHQLELALSQLYSLQTSQLQSSIELTHWMLAIHLMLVDHLALSGHRLQACSLIRLQLPHQPNPIRGLYHLILASLLLDLDRPADAEAELGHASTMSDDYPALQDEAELLDARLQFHRLKFDKAHHAFTRLSQMHPTSEFVRQMRILSALVSSPQLCLRRLQEIDVQSTASEQHPLLAYLISWMQNPSHSSSACVWERLVQVVPPRFHLEGHLEQAFKELKLFLFSQQHQALSHPELALVLDHSSDDEGIAHSLEFAEAMIRQQKLDAQIDQFSGQAAVVFGQSPPDPLACLFFEPPAASIQHHADSATPERAHTPDDSPSSPTIPLSPARRPLCPEPDVDDPPIRLRPRRKHSHPHPYSVASPAASQPSSDSNRNGRPALAETDDSEPDFPLSRFPPHSSMRVPGPAEQDLRQLIGCSATPEEGLKAYRAYEAYRSQSARRRTPKGRCDPHDKNYTRLRRYLKYFELLGGVSGWPITARKVELWARGDPPRSAKAFNQYLRSLEGARLASEAMFEDRFPGLDGARLQQDEALARLAKLSAPTLPASSISVPAGLPSEHRDSGQPRRASGCSLVRALVVDSDDEVLPRAKAPRLAIFDSDEEHLSHTSEPPCELGQDLSPELARIRKKTASRLVNEHTVAPALCPEEGAGMMVAEQGCSKLRAGAPRTGLSERPVRTYKPPPQPNRNGATVQGSCDEMDDAQDGSGPRNGPPVSSPGLAPLSSHWDSAGDSSGLWESFGSCVRGPSSSRLASGSRTSGLGSPGDPIGAQDAGGQADSSPVLAPESRLWETLGSSSKSGKSNGNSCVCTKAQAEVGSANEPRPFSSPLSSPAPLPTPSPHASDGGTPEWSPSSGAGWWQVRKISDGKHGTDHPEGLAQLNPSVQQHVSLEETPDEDEADGCGRAAEPEEVKRRDGECKRRGEDDPNGIGKRALGTTGKDQNLKKDLLMNQQEEEEEEEEEDSFQHYSNSSLSVNNDMDNDDDGGDDGGGCVVEVDAVDHESFLRNMKGFMECLKKFL